jgi:hypothetical protein
MGVQMRIDSPRYRARALYDGHCHPFLSQWFKGWHARPGKETVSSPLLAQLARSPSRTGRASFQPHGPADKHLNHLGTTTSQTRPQEPLNVATTSAELVDPPINGISPVSLADMARSCVPDRHVKDAVSGDRLSVLWDTRSGAIYGSENHTDRQIGIAA